MRKRSVFATLAILALMFCMAIPAGAEFKSETRQGVAAVYTCFETVDGAELGFGSGTCFFVGKTGQSPSYLITNYHVIDLWEEFGSGELVTLRVSGGEVAGRSKIRVYFDANDYVEAYHMDSDSGKDVAILQLASPTLERVSIPVLIPTEEMVGKVVYSVGFPGLADNEIVGPTTKWGINDSSVNSGHISRLATTSGTGQTVLQLDFDIKHGNSGGPLVNEDGAVLGITTFSISNSGTQESMNYAVNIQEAVSLLNRNGIEFDFWHPSSLPVIPIAIGGSVVIIAVVVAVVLRRKPRPKPDSKGKDKPSPVAAKRPALLCMAPQHGGMMLNAENRQIVIGRKGCDVVFEDNTPGVSGRHCALYWDANAQEFVVTDFQSRYGTYLQNGQKLPANTPVRLKAGDAFYVGDRANMFKLDMV